MKLYKNRHSVYKLTYHIVLVTKHRHKCINDDVFDFMKNHIERIVTEWGGLVEEINHDYDHIHMLLSLPPQQAPSKAVCSIKTATSRVIRREFSDYLSKFYWKDSFWSDSYLVLTVGGATIDIVKKYIEEQREQK